MYFKIVIQFLVLKLCMKCFVKITYVSKFATTQLVRKAVSITIIEQKSKDLTVKTKDLPQGQEHCLFVICYFYPCGKLNWLRFHYFHSACRRILLRFSADMPR